MDALAGQRFVEKFVSVGGLGIRYLEQGEGVPAILLHGSSLGSSADVFRRNLGPLAEGGIRAIACDLPGFGKSPEAEATSNALRKRFILAFMDALGLERAALVGHSSAGNLAVGLGLDVPQRVSHVMVLGTGSLLPPLEAAGTRIGGNEAAAQARLEERMVRQEPTLADTRALIEANLFNHDLITEEELALRHRNSIGACFAAFAARHAAQRADGGNKGTKEGVPLWQKMAELPMPLLLIFGRNDRARAGERAELLVRKYPQLDLHIADGCKHLVPWDAADLFHELAIPFITGNARG
jgi:pimeloyl-ACP methyl ester carboxylesterase